MPETHLVRRTYYPARGEHTGVRKVTEIHETRPTRFEEAAEDVAVVVVQVAVGMLCLAALGAMIGGLDENKS